jgi:hypothetical protein
MRQIRRVGAAAAGVVAVALLATGCGSDSDGVSAGPTLVSETPTGEPTELFPTEELLPTEEAPYYEEEETVDPALAGPAAELDTLAAQKGWEYDDELYSASELVTKVCEELPTAEGEGKSPAQWLAEGIYFWDDGKQILLAGAPKLCPKWERVVKDAASGKYDRWFGDGTYVVTSKPAVEDGGTPIPPGTYRVEGNLKDCYWERTSESGEIIDNNFATSARKITVTVRSSDGQFTTERCGTWKPVK